jgi:hypothetical protein
MVLFILQYTVVHQQSQKANIRHLAGRMDSRAHIAGRLNSGFDREIGALPPSPPHLLYKLGGFGPGFRVHVEV